MTAANIIPTAPTDGIVYGTSVPIVSAEADLGDNLLAPRPIPVAEGQTIVVIVKLAVNGHVSNNKTWVFLQTDLGDGTWVDVAWCPFTLADGSGTAVLCGGGIGSVNNAFLQSRQAGSAPAVQAAGSNAVPLGGRVRVTGFGSSSGGSSSVAGTYAGVFATTTYRLQQPR